MMSSSFQKLGAFFFKHSNIVQRVYKASNYNDEPQLYQYSSQFIDAHSSKATDESTASGTSFDRNDALLKLLGETVERYSLGVYNKTALIYKSFNELANNSENALNPSELYIPPNFLKSNKANIKDIKVCWIMGKSLVTNRNILIPAQLVFVPYVYSKSEPMLQMQISTGAAAGETIYDAIYRGICEIIERDSFMIHYYNKIHSPRIDLQSLSSKKVSKIAKIFKRYNLELCVNDITTDIGVPAVVATVIDKTGMGPAICVGLKAGFDMNQNVIGATEEALMVRSWVRDEYIYSKSKRVLPKKISTIEYRASFWCPLEMISCLDFWINAKGNKLQHKFTVRRRSSYKEKVIELVGKLVSKGYEIVYVDITAPEVRKYGVKVVKVIIPQLQPLHLDEKYPYLTFSRMYNAPVNMGLFSKSKSLDELNNIPHPFL